MGVIVASCHPKVPSCREGAVVVGLPASLQAGLLQGAGCGVSQAFTAIYLPVLGVEGE